MGLTSLILGIISIVISVIPFCNYIGLLPAVVGIVFGVVSLTMPEKNEYNNKAIAITGICFGGISIIISLVWSILFLFSNSVY